MALLYFFVLVDIFHLFSTFQRSLVQLQMLLFTQGYILSKG